jgi:N-acetylglucosamine-6-phosphate deacetylase
MRRVKLRGNVITPDGILPNGCVLISGGAIEEVSEGDISCECEEICVPGDYISPGFVDLHTHGAGGGDFMDGEESSFLSAVATYPKFGTTAVLPTTLACSFDELMRFFALYRKVKSAGVGARLLGIHLEGPFFAKKQKGAQDERFILPIEERTCEEILAASDDIVRWSLAPELPGAHELADRLTRAGILPSVAHTEAKAADIPAAFAHGFRLMTHLYSGMYAFTRLGAERFAGAVEGAYLCDDMFVEIIADGMHLPREILQLVYKIKGPEKTALISDSMRAAGTDERESILGSKKNGQRVVIEDGVAKLPDHTALAGSVATGDRLVLTMVRAGIPVADAVKMAATTPAKLIGARTGRIQRGFDADITIFDREIRVKRTIILGQTVYRAE